jgi:hypothetical protein
MGGAGQETVMCGARRVRVPDSSILTFGDNDISLTHLETSSYVEQRTQQLEITRDAWTLELLWPQPRGLGGFP